MSDHLVLGIIGGAGVAATNKFNELLETKITNGNASRDSHHPVIISFQATQVPSRSMYLEGKGPSFIPGYIKVSMDLQKAGATILCMTCNTAHYAINEIQAAIELPIINIVKEVAKALKKYKPLKIGIMASDGSVQAKIYDKYIQEVCPKAEILYPIEELQAELTRGIVNIKNKNNGNIKSPRS